jgi:hypothetical protein
MIALVVGALGCGRLGFDARPAGDGGPADTGDGSIPVASCVPTVPSGMVIHVDAQAGSDANTGGMGSPVRTITRGIALAPPGSSLLVQPGDYNAEPGNEVQFDSLSDVRIISAQRYRARVPRIECFDCDGLLVEGFELTGSTGVCAQVSFGKNVTFRDNVIHDCGVAAVRIAGDITGTVIAGNVIYDSPNSLVHVNDNSQVDIVDNVIFDTRTQANHAMVWLEGTTNTVFARNVVYRGRHDSLGYGSVSIGTAVNLRIENNIVGPVDASAEGALGLDDADGTATISFNTFVGPFPGGVFGISRNNGVTAASTFTVTHNVWVSPGAGTAQPFSSASETGADGFSLDRNAYWNAAGAFTEPAGTLGPGDDPRGVTIDPQLAIAGGAAPPPPTFETPSGMFADGSTLTCDVRTKLIDAIARVPATSPVGGRALIAAPATDIRGKPRPMPAALGAYEP